MESDSEMKPEEPHWVAELFPPHFTLLDLLEGSDGRARLEEPGPFPQAASEKENQERGRRVQEIYRTALREVQLRESIQRRERLSKIIVVEGKSQETDPKRSGHEGAVSSWPLEQEGAREAEEEGGERCIWNARDLRALRAAAREAELDRRRLRAELRQARAEAAQQREERVRLQGLLDEREQRLGVAERAAAQHALRLEALRAEGRGRDALLERRAAEARERAREARAAAARAREAEEEAREVRRENARLARELERLRDQREEEGRRREQEARAENEEALRRLQREVEAAWAELEVERQSHARSQAALELLRRHFTGQPSPETRQGHADRISYI